MIETSTVTVVGHDGLRMAATAVVPTAPSAVALLLHDAGRNRDQAGLFPQLAAALAERATATLRIDLPGHGASEGQQEELTLSGLLNMISAGLRHLRTQFGPTPTGILGTGLTGGVAAGYAARRGAEIDRLVLVDAVIDYQAHFAGERNGWHNDVLAESTAHELTSTGRLAHSPGFVVGRALLNEVFWLQPRGVLGAISAATLVMHSAEADVPVSSSRSAAAELTCEHHILESDTADRTTLVIQPATAWLARDST